MKLVDLDPMWVIPAYFDHHQLQALSLESASGICFMLPAHGHGDEDFPDHQVVIWFARKDVPEGQLPKGRHKYSGNDFEDLTISGSIKDEHGRWNITVVKGEVGESE